jgi:hypothetical protein
MAESKAPALQTTKPEPVPPEPSAPAKPVEIGGREGPDPTRYGDWEKNGRCIDF